MRRFTGHAHSALAEAYDPVRSTPSRRSRGLGVYCDSCPRYRPLQRSRGHDPEAITPETAGPAPHSGSWRALAQCACELEEGGPPPIDQDEIVTLAASTATSAQPSTYTTLAAGPLPQAAAEGRRS